MEAYQRSVEMIDLYDRHGVDVLPPIVIWRQGHKTHLLDGHKRGTAALSVGLAALPAYEVVKAGDRQLVH